jgi:hypothetical protein
VIATRDPAAVELEVISWRREQLEHAGIRPKVALALSVSAADLHVMLAAKAAGASDEQLRRIFE